MTDRRTWQKREQHIAEDHGTKRNPFSGDMSHQTHSDSLHPVLFIESKLRVKIPFRKLFIDTRTKARKEKKIPVIVLSEKGSPIRSVILDYDDYLKMMKPEYRFGTIKEDEHGFP